MNKKFVPKVFVARSFMYLQINGSLIVFPLNATKYIPPFSIKDGLINDYLSSCFFSTKALINLGLTYSKRGV